MAETPLTNRQIIQKPDIVVDPNFPVPPGIEEVRQGTERDFGLRDRTGTSSTSGTSPTGPGTGTGDGGVIDPNAPVVVNPTPGGLGVPDGLLIESQNIRFNPDGTYVVDAVLVFTDVPNATSYEVRLTKVE